MVCIMFLFKQKTAYELRISDWSSDVCSSDLPAAVVDLARGKRVSIFAPASPAMHRRWFNALRSSCGSIVEAQFFTTRSAATREFLEDRKRTRLNSSH